MNPQEIEQSIMRLAEAGKPLAEGLVTEYVDMSIVSFGVCALGFILLASMIPMFIRRGPRLWEWAVDKDAEPFVGTGLLCGGITYIILLIVFFDSATTHLQHIVAPHYYLLRGLL